MFALIIESLYGILAAAVLFIAVYCIIKPENRYISRDAYERKKLKKLKREI
ncbi:MAG: hypothetical protein NTW46_03905 [Candidatus Nealsonbacteria bacterium]|nr:hypothetical protein [Candidatus Nealsonbacteria bacterium]